MTPDEELLAGWVRTERLLREVLAEHPVDPATQQWIEEFLDHNELGLAYETLVESLARPIPEQVRARLVEAAAVMGLEAPAE